MHTLLSSQNNFEKSLRRKYVNCAQCAGPIISLDTYDSVTVTVDYKLCAFQVLICPSVRLSVDTKHYFLKK